MAKEQFLVNPSSDVAIDIVSNNIIITDSELEKYVQEEKNSHLDNDIDQKKAADNMNSFYEVVDRCSEGEVIIGEIEKCSETVWSSHYPDPKSEISGADPYTGKLF